MLDEPFGGLDPLVRDQLIEGLLERAPESTVFISSHDLAETESFASHIGYLEQGRLRFSEEMTALPQRFREGELTLDERSTSPGSLPRTWVHAYVSAAVVRFIKTRFDEDRTSAEIHIGLRCPFPG